MLTLTCRRHPMLLLHHLRIEMSHRMGARPAWSAWCANSEALLHRHHRARLRGLTGPGCSLMHLRHRVSHCLPRIWCMAWTHRLAMHHAGLRHARRIGLHHLAVLSQQLATGRSHPKAAPLSCHFQAFALVFAACAADAR